MKGLPHRVTIRHLLHHTSGLRDWPGTLFVAGWRFDDVISFDQILRMAYAQRTLNFEPGTEHMYSEHRLQPPRRGGAAGDRRDVPGVGQTAHIFQPLGMTSSRFRDDHREVVPNRAIGYARTATGFHHTPNNLTALGSSSLFSTVDDMAKWMANFDSARVGGTALQALRTRGTLNDGADVSYAWGVQHGAYRGLPMFTHSGSWASFNTFVVYLPEQRFGVVALANSPVVNAQDAVIRITNIYLEKELGLGDSGPMMRHRTRYPRRRSPTCRLSSSMRMWDTTGSDPAGTRASRGPARVSSRRRPTSPHSR